MANVLADSDRLLTGGVLSDACAAMLGVTASTNSPKPESAAGAKFICERTSVAAVSKWLAANGWSVVTSELGYVPKQFPELTEAQLNEVGEFLHALDEHDDVHRVWAAMK